METARIISKDDIVELIDRFIVAYQVIAPSVIDDRVMYKYVSDASEVDLEYRGHTLLPPKKFFFPEKEVLFTYEISDKGTVSIYDKCEELKGLQRVFIGIKPCDISSLKILDKVLISEFHDPYYAMRRNNTLLIGITCSEPLDYCFCYYTGSGPSTDDGYDLLLTDLGEEYLVRIGSNRGLMLIKYNIDLFKEANEEKIALAKKLIEEAELKMREQGLPSFENIYEVMIKNFNSKIWEEYGRACLACGKCNFTCPTCTCFDIFDEVNLDLKSGRRVRVWDSCHFLSFTQVASGEIFRKSRPSRVKQRIYHKYCYSLDEIGVISCVGCGRCIEVCTARIDLRDIIRRLYGYE